MELLVCKEHSKGIWVASSFWEFLFLLIFLNNDSTVPGSDVPDLQGAAGRTASRSPRRRSPLSVQRSLLQFREGIKPKDGLNVFKWIHLFSPVFLEFSSFGPSDYPHLHPFAIPQYCWSSFLNEYGQFPDSTKSPHSARGSADRRHGQDHCRNARIRTLAKSEKRRRWLHWICLRVGSVNDNEVLTERPKIALRPAKGASQPDRCQRVMTLPQDARVLCLRWRKRSKRGHLRWRSGYKRGEQTQREMPWAQHKKRASLSWRTRPKASARRPLSSDEELYLGRRCTQHWWGPEWLCFA